MKFDFISRFYCSLMSCACVILICLTLIDFFVKLRTFVAKSALENENKKDGNEKKRNIIILWQISKIMSTAPADDTVITDI
jgi:hypothetical protein